MMLSAVDGQGDRFVLTLTGERTLPGIATENYWFRRHEAAYAWAARFCRGAIVIDAGAGEAYGADLLAGTADRVVALDYDAAAVRHAAATYPRLRVARANLDRLPLADGAVEVLVCLQVVEHLWDQPGFLRECARVLRPAGTLIVSTPNRLTFPPGNPFHSRELAPAELTDLLAAEFDVTRLRGVRHGRRLRRLDRRYGAGLVGAQLAGPVATWHPRLRLDVAAVRADDFVVAGDHLERSLDLLALAVRRPRRGRPVGGGT